MTPLCAALFLLAAPATAQTVGGSFETLYQWDGGAMNDKLGASVSDAGDVNGDGFGDLLVGAPGTDDAYVYSGADGSLLHQWGPVAGLGNSVSGAGDVNGDGFDDLIVGASISSPGGLSQAGSAYVYSGADGSLLHQWNGGAAGDRFGSSVSGAGDVNGDGFPDLIVGAPFADPVGLSSAGSVYVYSGADGSLLHQWNGGDAYFDYGSSVSGAGDVNGDGFSDLIVGAPGGGPVGQEGAGSAYVYSGADSSLLYQWDGLTSIDHLGNAVSDAGDVNLDGFDDLLVGALFASPGGLWTAGSAYVYSGADGSLLHQMDGNAVFDNLGYSVSGAGDVSGDGVPDLLVGANNTAPGGLSSAGSAYAYSGADGSLLHQWDGGAASDRFGESVSGAGDVNGDGLHDLIVGAHYADPGGFYNSGSVFVYSFNPFMRANIATVSASAGGVLDLALDFPDAAGFDDYKILISATGTGPTNYGVDIPLTQDSLVVDTFLGNYPVPVYSGLHGTLDANGDGFGSLTVPAGIPSSLIGKVYYLAAIASQPGQLPEFSSMAVLLEITP